MSQRRRIKIHLSMFLVFLCAFVAIFLYLFQKNFQQFSAEIFERSEHNLEIIDSISKIETNLYIHKKSLFRFVNTSGKKWLSYIDDTKAGVRRQFTFLEDFNQRQFKSWISIEDYQVENPQEELKKQIIEFQKGRAGEDHFQRLFYLLRYNINQYFQLADERIASIQEKGAGASVNSIDDEEAYVQLIYAGIDQLVNVYNSLFWDYAQAQNLRYSENTSYYFYTLALCSTILVLFSFFLVSRIMKYFQSHQFKEERQSLLGQKDLITGLFNREALENLGQKEVDRAKRRGHHLSVVFINVDPITEIRKSLGDLTVDRLMVQIVDVLKHVCRSYDGVFKYSENQFVLILAESNKKTMDSLVRRLDKKLLKKSFALVNGEDKIIPEISVGFGVYPTDGESFRDLLEVSMNALGEEAQDLVRHHEGTIHKKEEPVLKEQQNAAAIQAMFETEDAPEDQAPVADQQEAADQNADSQEEELPSQEWQDKGQLGAADEQENPQEVAQGDEQAAPEDSDEEALSLEEPIADTSESSAEEYVDVIQGDSDLAMSAMFEEAAQNDTPATDQEQPVAEAEAESEAELEAEDEPVFEALAEQDEAMSAQPEMEPEPEVVAEAESAEQDSLSASDDDDDDDLPDVVVALKSDSLIESVDQEDPAQLARSHESQDVSWEVDAEQTDHGQDESEFFEVEEDAVSPGISEIQVIQADDEDVIMVDFDSDKEDLAENFRRRIKHSRSKSVL